MVEKSGEVCKKSFIKPQMDRGRTPAASLLFKRYDTIVSLHMPTEICQNKCSSRPAFQGHSSRFEFRYTNVTDGRTDGRFGYAHGRRHGF